MIMKSIEVHNYRSIRNATLELDALTVLVGPNGAGKSSFLRALDSFFKEGEQFNENDFYNRDTSQDIEFVLTFTELTEEEKDFFAAYVQGDELIVVKVGHWLDYKPKITYHGEKLYYPGFDAFRDAKGQTELKSTYNGIKESLGSLPDYSTKAPAEKALAKWEEVNPARCEKRIDDGQFFGWKGVGGSYLRQRIERVFIRAVRDAADVSIDRKGTPIYDIMDIVARRALSGRPEFQEFSTRTQENYEKMMAEITREDLAKVSDSLNNILKGYAPNAGVEVDWDSKQTIDVPPPSAAVRLVEDGFPSPVQACGHGVQRAFILTLLQYLASLQNTPDLASPSLLIAIEEPELYQHPTRQRHLSQILAELAIEGETQVIYTTHSPLFVDIGRYSSVRRISKNDTGSTTPMETVVTSAAGNEILREIERIDKRDEGHYSREYLESKLQNLMTPWMNEGFFANTLVLVEGPEDLAFLTGVAEYLEHNIDALGISIISCGGKSSICYPSRIFKYVGIPVYVIWDSDKDDNSQIASNKKLLRMLGLEEEDWPHGIAEEHACFEIDMRSTFIEEVGDGEFNAEMESWAKSWSLTRKKAEKNPKVLKEVIHALAVRGLRSGTLEKIVEEILRYHQRSTEN